jgi:hypothetical protein
MGPPRVKMIRGAHADLRSFRGQGSIWIINIQGSKIDSLKGIERFPHVRQITFENARTDDLRAVVPLREQLKTLRIMQPATRTDLDSVLELGQLEALSLYLYDEEDARRASIAPFERLPHLRELLLIAPEDYGIDMAADWFPQLSDLGHVWFGKFGIREEDTEAVCRAGPELRHLQFRERSPEQTQRIAQALGAGVTDTWEPPEPSYGVIFEIDGTFSVSLSFPREESGMDQYIAAQRLLSGKWSDLANDVETDAGGDEVVFRSSRRDVLDELVKRATAARLV